MDPDLFDGNSGPADFAHFGRQLQKEAVPQTQIVGTVGLFGLLMKYLNMYRFLGIGGAITATVGTVWAVIQVTESRIDEDVDDRTEDRTDSEPKMDVQLRDTMRTWTKTAAKRRNKMFFFMLPLVLLPAFFIRRRRKGNR